MAQTTNMEILSFLLQDIAILEYTPQYEQDRINVLPPLDSFTKGDEPRQFIYDKDEGLICYMDNNPIFQTLEYQRLLSQKPILDFLGIQVFEAKLSVMPLS